MSRLTDSSRHVDCIRCHQPHAYACHYNGPRQHDFGKGRGQKCDDMMTADFCMSCDSRFSEGSTSPDWANKWERSEEFMYWISLTNIRRLQNGVLTIGAIKP